MFARASGVLAILLLLVCSMEAAPVMAVRWDWTAQEVACAQTIGVDLRGVVNQADPYFVRHLAWLAEEIVFGTVREIKHDIKGAYATQVRIDVSAITKGTVSSNTIWVDLVSGPHYNPQFDRMEYPIRLGEQQFRLGEVVLLFLDRDYDIQPDNPSYWALQEGHYRPIDESKWLVANGVVQQEGNPANLFSVAAIKTEFDVAISAQQSNCQ